MGSLREAARDRDWQGGLGLAHCRLGSVEFVVMIYRNQPPRYPDLAALPARKARRHGRSRRREFRVMNYRTARSPLRDEPPPVSYGVSSRGRPRSGLAGGLGLAHCRLGSVEFVVMIYRNQPPRYPDLAALPARKARRHGEGAATGRAACERRHGED